MSTSTTDKADLGLPSRHVTDGLPTALNRIFFHAMGVDGDALRRPVVGVAAAWDGGSASAGTPLRYTAEVQAGVWAAGGLPRRFATIADDVAGADRTLVGRELVADSVELTVRGHSQDALVGVSASEAGLAGLLLVACRLDVPARVVALTGPAFGGGDDLRALAVAAERLGLREPADPTGDPIADARAAGQAVCAAIATRRGARSGVDAASLRDAARAATAAGGSLRVLLHLAAIAVECGVAFDLEDAVGAADGDGRWCTGTLAPDGAAVSGPPAPAEGPCRVFASQDDAVAAFADGWPAAIVVVRGQGPRSAPGLRDLARLAAAAAVVPAPEGAALISDGTVPPVPGVRCVSCVGPESGPGAPLAALRDGDRVRVDPVGGRVDGTPSGAADGPPADASLGPRERKYRRLVGVARHGAATHPGASGEVRRYPEI